MDNVKVKKSELLEVLKNNRQSHRKIFEEALSGYRRKVIEVFEQRLREAREGYKITHYIKLSEPVDQTKDYDRAIKMLEMSIEEEIELSQSEFACYVMDDWGWRANFLNTNAVYSKSAEDLIK